MKKILSSLPVRLIIGVVIGIIIGLGSADLWIGGTDVGGTIMQVVLTLKNLLHFAILAFGVGCFQGSIQSLSRSYYSKIIPAENSGEYFGIYDIFAKGASFLGSAVLAAVKLLGGSINVAVACLTVFFALGFVFLKIADKQKSSRAAE